MSDQHNNPTLERMEDNYLACRHYANHGDVDENRIAKFTNDNGQHYFVWYSRKGEVLMRSEGYPTTAARDNGADSVLRNRDLPERYKVVEIAGRWFVILKAANHQEIARSCPYDSEEAARNAYPVFNPEADQPEPVVGVTREAAPVSDERREDNYLSCREYRDAGSPDENGFIKFQHPNGEFYFAWVNAAGDVILRSEGYTSAAARDNGINSVIKNRDIEARYSFFELAGRWFVILKAGNHQEIGRSCPFESEAAARAAYPVFAASTEITVERTVVQTETPVERIVVEVPVVAAPEIIVSKDKEDDYLPCNEYAGRTPGDGDIALFQHANGQYYFVWYDENGSVLLRSEGFKTEADRQEELELVLKYREDEDRYTVIERGQYKMAILKTPEGREIGRSCLEKDEPEPVAAPEPVAVAAPVVEPVPVAPIDVEDDYLACQEYRGHGGVDKNGIATFKHSNGQYYFVWYDKDGNVLLRSEGFRTEADRQKELDLVLKYRDDKDRYSVIEKAGMKMRILKTPEGREIGRSCLEKEVAPVPAPVVAAAAPAPKVVAPVDVEDDYLVCQEYRGHKAGDNGIATFKHSNGQFYFVWYDKDGNVLLRSEGFRTEADRQNELDLVLKHRDDNALYSVIEKAGMKMRILKTPEGREIGRSCLEKEVTPLPVAPVAAAAAVAAAAPKVTYTPPAKDKEDDYLACDEYKKRGTPDKNGIVRFRHPNGKKYFVWYDKDGNVLLRSEGFTTNADLERELNAVLRRRKDDSNYEVIERNGYRMRVLRDEKGREVGRSCLEKIEVAVPAPAPVAVPAPAVTVPKVTPPKVKVEEPVVTASSNFKWWWLLPLLLLPLLFYFLRGCEGCKKPTATVEPPKVEATAPVVEPTPPPAPAVVCDCNAGTDPVFKLPKDRTPKSLTRLGTNPEFGNSHGLTGAQFYEKIAKAAETNKVDKDFLDRVFKGMGYANGFADAKPEMFSEVTLTPGTIGNMGKSKKHLTVYAVLNTTGQDLEAFRIKSANGCDLHFMKTCGNHFFFCPN